jgi:hypothetical protein
MTALLGGQVQFAIDNITVVRPLLQDNWLRALAVTSRSRQPDYPDLPTMIEAGVPDYEVTSFFGVVAPAATPAEIVDKLNRAINAALRTTEMKGRWRSSGHRGPTKRRSNSPRSSRPSLANGPIWRTLPESRSSSRAVGGKRYRTCFAIRRPRGGGPRSCCTG